MSKKEKKTEKELMKAAVEIAIKRCHSSCVNKCYKPFSADDIHEQFDTRGPSYAINCSRFKSPLVPFQFQRYLLHVDIYPRTNHYEVLIMVTYVDLKGYGGKGARFVKTVDVPKNEAEKA